MFIETLFDKTAVDEKLHTGWGLSFLIDNRFIFDTGEKGPWLMENMDKLKVPMENIEAIIISHDHWDHWGGLWDLLKNGRCRRVYICPRFGDKFKKKAKKHNAELIESPDFIEIYKNIYITGQIDGLYDGTYIAEQALAIRTQNGISIITGCAHPGIVKIIEKVKSKFMGESIYTLIGGFHLMHEDETAIKAVVNKFREIGVKKVYSTHCSGDKAASIFLKNYSQDCGEVIVGRSIEI